MLAASARRIIPMPPHAYVPGESARHAEGAFDALRADPETAWRAGCHYLAEGYFWEAHEMLEAVWMAQPQGSAERRVVQALIQVANAGLKARMGRPRAVERLWALAEAGFANERGVVFGVSVGSVRARLAAVSPNRIDMCNIVHCCREIGADALRE